MAAFSGQSTMLSKKLAIELLNGRIADQWKEERSEPLVNLIRPPFLSNLSPLVPKMPVSGFGYPNVPTEFQQNPVPEKISPSAVPTFSNEIKIELDKAELWNEFHRHVTEMVVTKIGRRMFPTLRFTVSGLDPAATYGFYIVFSPADNFRYKFQNGKWSLNGQAENTNLSPALATYQHPDSPAAGRMWMSQVLSFHKIKLTNCPKTRGDKILLNSMQKYQPRLVVVKLHDNFSGRPLQIVAEFAFPETQFIAVTAYQNSCITRLKVQHNPFAKGFRHNDDRDSAEIDANDEERGTTEKKRKSIDSETLETAKRQKSGMDRKESESVPKTSPCSIPTAPQWSSMPASQIRAYYLATEMAKAAANVAAANDFYRRQIPAPTPIAMSPISPFPLFSLIGQPPPLRPYGQLLNPITAPDMRLPTIDNVYPNLPSGPGFYGGNGVRFTMY